MNGYGKHGTRTQRSEFATTEDIRKIFADSRDGLKALARFVTEDQELVEACVVDACAIAETQHQVFHEWLLDWARRATIRSAAQRQHVRIAQLASTYEHGTCGHKQHSASPDLLQLLVEEPGIIRARLDVLCRFALVMRGIEKYCCLDAALLLGINKSAVENAYCAALESLDALNCSMLPEFQDCAVSN